MKQLHFKFMEPKELKFDKVAVYRYARYAPSLVEIYRDFGLQKEVQEAILSANTLLEDLPWRVVDE